MGWITPTDVLNQGTTAAALQSEQHTQTDTAKAPTHLSGRGRRGHVESSLVRGRPSVHPDSDRKPMVLGDSQAKAVSSSARPKVPPFRLRNRGRERGVKDVVKDGW